MRESLAMKYLLAFFLFCSSAWADPVTDVVTSTDTFAFCKAADVVSTIYVIEHGIGVEANPIVAGLLAHGYIPFILLSAGIYWLIKEANNPVATGITNVVTCGAAVNNLLLIP